VEQVLIALGATRRREILRFVSGGERSAGEIHRALGDLTFGAVSQHLGILEAAGLLTARRAGRRRLYAARPEGLEPLREWLDSMWTEALSSLRRLAEEEESGTRRAGRRPTAVRQARGRGRGRRER
jgi:DNA-binding transcriptional ArsR family regulator